MDYVNQFDTYDDYMALFGASSLKNFIDLKELLTKTKYDFEYLHNNTMGAYHLG